MTHFSRKTSTKLRRVFRFGTTLLSVCGLVALALATFLPAANPVSNKSLSPRLSAPQSSAMAQAGRPDKTTPPDKITPSDKVIVGQAAQFDVSKPLRNIVPLPEEPASIIREMGEPGETEEGFILQDHPTGEDPVVQRQFGPETGAPVAPNMPSPIVNFAGLTNIDGVYPPDTNGDVGPNHYVQWVNSHFQIFNKSGTSLYGPAAGNVIWSGFGGPCETRNDGDPVVLYDSFADRWLMTQFTAAAPYGECVAVSVTGDPTGAYYRYFFSFSNTIFYDYPKLGVWPDGYYLSANRFSASFVGASAIVLDRARMLNGQSATYQEFQTSTAYGTLLPADHDGLTPPPAGSPNFFAEIGATALRLWRFHVDWTTPANSTFTGPSSLTVAAFTQLCPGNRNCIPQTGTSIGLDGIGDRLMHRLVYRNFGDHEALAVNHTVSVGGQAAVRWYEVRNPNGAAAIYQQGTYAPDATHRWMGSLAFDGAGNLALGYSASSATMYPSIRYTGRLVTDTLGQLPQGETSIITGTGAQTGTGYRWGDYSNMSIDPVDDCTFWYTNEYLATTGTAPWVTRIASFKFPSCTSILIPSLMANGINTSDASGGNNNGVIEPGESIQLDIGLNNIGNVTATNVSGVVASMTSAASMLNNVSPYNDIGRAATVLNTTPYTFAVSTQLTCGQPVTLALTATYSVTRTYNYTFSLPTGAVAAAANFENFDGVTAPTLPAGWTTSVSGSGVAWVTSSTTSDSAPNNTFAPNPSTAGESNLVTPVFTPTTTAARLTFRNNYNLESSYDGAVLEIRIGGGAFTDIVAAGGSFVTGGYNGTISTLYSNPLAGRSAWTGNSGGYITTTVNLPASATGQGVQLRWRVGTDTSIGATGQRIDTITLADGYTCATYLAPHTYADPALVCAGNAPCYATPQAALNGVANNGIVTILGTHNVAATLTSGNAGANNVTIDGTGTLNWTGVANPLINIAAGNVAMKGLTVTNASTVFNQTGSGSLTAYANNFASFVTAYSSSGTHNLGHNYWGTTDPLAAAPTGFSAGEWAARLGAPITSWSEGTGSTTLVTGANTAALTGGSGTAVIVSHGRGQANAPFGNGIVPYVNQMCSDFYDLFTVNGGGTWTAQIPVDNTTNCNTNTLTPRRVAWITALAQCSPTTNTACWNALALARVSVNGQNLSISNLTVAELGGTPFVAGDPSGADPTAVSLTSLTVQNHGDSAGVLLAGILILFSVSVILLARRRRLA